MFLDPIKHVLRVFLNGLKIIPQRSCPSGLKAMVQIVRGRVIPFLRPKSQGFSRTFQDPTLKFQGPFFSKNLPQTKQNSRTLYFVYLNICFHWLHSRIKILQS